MAIEVLAPAKVNLSLHVTGQRADGYHLIDSLVSFAPFGDRVRLDARAGGLDLSVDGPEAAGVPTDNTNLVLRAAELLARPGGPGAAITLHKDLPAAAGLGGGSSDAAATLRGLMRLWQRDDLVGADDAALADFAHAVLALGADIPMCLICQPARIRGIGERIAPTRAAGPAPAVLVNPRVPVATAAVFAALDSRDNAPMPDQLPLYAGVRDLAAWLGLQRNDLQDPAIAIAPEIGAVIDALEAEADCLMARMSGSGATCFALFPDTETMTQSAQKLAQDHPEWWVRAGVLGDQSETGAPRPMPATGSGAGAQVPDDQLIRATT